MKHSSSHQCSCDLLDDTLSRLPLRAAPVPAPAVTTAAADAVASGEARDCDRRCGVVLAVRSPASGLGDGVSQQLRAALCA